MYERKQECVWSKIHCLLCYRNPNTYNLILEWPWHQNDPDLDLDDPMNTIRIWCSAVRKAHFMNMTWSFTQWPWYLNLTQIWSRCFTRQTNRDKFTQTILKHCLLLPSCTWGCINPVLICLIISHVIANNSDQLKFTVSNKIPYYIMLHHCCTDLDTRSHNKLHSHDRKCWSKNMSLLKFALLFLIIIPLVEGWWCRRRSPPPPPPPPVMVLI